MYIFHKLGIEIILAHLSNVVTLCTFFHVIEKKTSKTRGTFSTDLKRCQKDQEGERGAKRPILRNYPYLQLMGSFHII